MPELAAAYFVGLFACLSLTILYVFLRSRRRQSTPANTLQMNLKKADLFWSDSRDSVVSWDKAANDAETKKSQKAIGLTGTMLSLLSWVGFLFLMIIMLSERFFARSRRERRLFSSELAKNSSLSSTQVLAELDRLEVRNAAPSEAFTVN